VDEEWEEANSGIESDVSVSEEFASSRASRKAANRRSGRGRGKTVPRDQDCQNVTNWNFLEYASSPELMMPLAPDREEGEKRKAGRLLGSSNKKKYTFKVYNNKYALNTFKVFFFDFKAERLIERTASDRWDLLDWFQFTWLHFFFNYVSK
jgi:hypothetical protein